MVVCYSLQTHRCDCRNQVTSPPGTTSETADGMNPGMCCGSQHLSRERLAEILRPGIAGANTIADHGAVLDARRSRSCLTRSPSGSRPCSPNGSHATSSRCLSLPSAGRHRTCSRWPTPALRLAARSGRRSALAYRRATKAGDEPRRQLLLEEVVRPLDDIRRRRPGYNIALVKAGVTLRGLPVGSVRPPLGDVAPGDLDELSRVLRAR
jgi:hypothetical protein